MKTPKHEIQSFLYGYKPSYLHARGFNFPYQTEDEIKQLGQYPFVEVVSLGSYQQVLYFQNDELKDKFISSGIDYTKDSREFQLLLGYTLGYPPKAVQYFVKHYWNNGIIDAVREDKIRMSYCGFSFAACICDLEENSEWLWNTYGYPGDIEVMRRLNNKKRIEWTIPFKSTKNRGA